MSPAYSARPSFFVTGTPGEMDSRPVCPAFSVMSACFVFDQNLHGNSAMPCFDVIQHLEKYYL
jgi:hypothetical protein